MRQGVGLAARMADPIRFVLDGADVAVEADPKTSTLDVLREQLGVFVAKAGCSPQGLCGCCTVLVDGKPRLTCTLPVKSVGGKSITTLAGLTDAERALIADAFCETGAAQCGYCTPGIALSTHALLQANPSPTEEDAIRAINLHTCRCTGYTAILAGIERAAEAHRGGRASEPGERPEGAEIVLGQRPFVDDLSRPGMLHGVLVFAPKAVGTVTRLDVSAAEAMGVRAIEVLRAVGEAVLHAGDPVALVAADTLAAARAAARAVVVEVEGRELVDFARSTEVIARGERRVEGGRGALHRVEDTVELAATDPVFLEPEAALAVPVDDGIVVYSAGHDAEGFATALTAQLGVDVRVVLVPSGGSYGGKAAMTVEPHAARLARATGRPVRVSVDLEEGMRLHPKRPAARVRVALGVDTAGKLTLGHVRVWLDGGAAPVDADGLVAAALGAFAYTCDDLEIEVSVLRTDAVPTGPIRGAGALAVTFAVERAMDALAGACHLDPWELRARNVDGDGRAVLDAVRDVWSGEGTRGLAVARVPGRGGARVHLEVASASEVLVQCNVPELGQGRDEALVTTLSTTTGLPASAFTVEWGDSRIVGPAALAPVEGAAAAAGALLATGGGSLAERVGLRIVGESPAAAPDGWSAQVVVLDGEGAVREVHVAALVGEQAGGVARGLAEGAAHMGAGVALSEQVESFDGLPEFRFRMLGVLKPKVSPRIRSLVVGGTGPARDVSEAAVCATPAAIANAVSRAEGAARRSLPMKDSAAAKAAGVRQPRA